MGIQPAGSTRFAPFIGRCDSPGLQIVGEMISLARVDHHIQEDGDFVGACSFCHADVWTDSRVELLRELEPLTPVLCCHCTHSSEGNLKQLHPGAFAVAASIPDLAELMRRKAAGAN